MLSTNICMEKLIMTAALKIRPLGDRLVVEPEKVEEKTKGGIYLPETANQEKPVWGKVIAIGEGKIEDGGKRKPLDVKIGDKILFGKYAGTNFKLDEQELLVLREDDVMGVVE
jgi:chaperonin GroES